MRKDADFNVTDHIIISIEGNDKLADIINRNKEDIFTAVVADELVTGSVDGHTAEWSINGEKATFGVKVNK